jgi:hypothetical protein
MIIQHNLFKPPTNTEQKIWRYIDFTKLLDLINSKSLYFTRSDCFEDKFEGSLPIPSIQFRKKYFESLNKLYPEADYSEKSFDKLNREFKKEIALNCWHMNDFESVAMWKLYLKSNEGIAIQTTYSRLVKSLESSEIKFMLGVVNYIDYENDFLSPDNLLRPFLHKRKSFIHEHELRCLTWQTNPNSESLKNGGIKIKVDLEYFIQNIYLSPESPTWLKILIQDIVKKYGFKIPVINSKLNDLALF